MTPEETTAKAQSPPPSNSSPIKNSSPSLAPPPENHTASDLRDKVAAFKIYSNAYDLLSLEPYLWSLIRLYDDRVIEDIVKPSIKAFMETCDTNPRIAVRSFFYPGFEFVNNSLKAIVATPALLAFLLVIAFLQVHTRRDLREFFFMP